jgi:sugar (pentulose or hexulose) kinase
MESVAFLLRDNVEALRQLGAEITEIRTLGGASASALWLQIKADVLELPLAVVKCKEATALGAAILGVFFLVLRQNIWHLWNAFFALFAVTAALAVIVIYDAANVRYYSGQNIKVTQQLVKDVQENLHTEFDDPIYQIKLKDVLGHRWTEVVGGFFVGAFISLLFHYCF